MAPVSTLHCLQCRRVSHKLGYESNPSICYEERLYDYPICYNKLPVD